MKKILQWMDRAFYPSFADRWDDRIFRERILPMMRPDADVLDVGAGRGAKADMSFRGQCRFMAGVDPDSAVLENPYLDEARVMNPPDYRIPYPDGSFDIVISNCVLEHVANSQAYFAEIARVLRPGGEFLAKTPNRRHYVPTIARATPHWFHEYYNHLRGREHRDTFPTVYACNTRRDIGAAAKRGGFEVADFTIVEGRPEYLRIAVPLYAIGLLYERFVNRFSFLEGFRSVILFRLTKRAEGRSLPSRGAAA